MLQGLSGLLVELACDSAEFGLTKIRYIGAFGEVLPKKEVGIFIASALPRIAGQAIVKRAAERVTAGHKSRRGPLWPW